MFFMFSKWQLATIFKSIKFYMLTRLGGTRHITMPNFFSKLLYPQSRDIAIFQFSK